MKIKYKQIIRQALAALDVEMTNGYFGYYNDLMPASNKTTSRRFKIGINRAMSEFKLGTLQGMLGAEFNCKVDTKQTMYMGDKTVIIYLRRN